MEKWEMKGSDEALLREVEVEVEGRSSASESDSGSAWRVGVMVVLDVGEVVVLSFFNWSSSRFLSFLLFFPADLSVVVDDDEEDSPAFPFAPLPLGPITPPKTTPFFFFLAGSPSSPLVPALPADVVSGASLVSLLLTTGVEVREKADR
jgi:hypothetical protein